MFGPQQLEETKKEVFNLQLENHFLKERLSNMAPEHIEGALKENVKLKLEILTLGKELKKLKKLVMQQDKDLAAAVRESGKSQEARELENLWNQEKERRKAAEQEIKTLQEEIEAGGMDELRSKLEDAEASGDVWRKRTEELEAELEDQKALNEDQIEELGRFRNAMDRAHDEMERMKEELNSAKSLSESIGLGKGREARLAQKIQELEQARMIISTLTMLTKNIGKRISAGRPFNCKERRHV